MSKLFFFLIISTLLSTSSFGQACTGCEGGRSRGGDDSENSRYIPAGSGQEYTGNFLSVRSFYFVQFAVYPSSISCQTIKAPKGLGMVWLINHPGTRVRGQSQAGAFYVVKAFKSRYQAQVHVNKYKQQGIDCWLNVSLTGSSFHIERIYM